MGADLTRLATALATLAPELGTTTFPVADGVGVLCGPGMYVNRVLACGITAPITDRHVDLVEQRAADVGVPPAFEVTDLALDSTTSLLRDRGYEPLASEVTVMIRDLDAVTFPELASGIDVVAVGDDDTLLSRWQQTAVVAWGHADARARRPSDLFAAATARSYRPGLLLAIDRADGRSVGCAALAINGAVATLGAMATVPDERRRGVQRALVSRRLQLALEAGCDIAATSAVTGGDSARNLQRCGFVAVNRRRTFERSTADR